MSWKQFYFLYTIDFLLGACLVYLRLFVRCFSFWKCLYICWNLCFGRDCLKLSWPLNHVLNIMLCFLCLFVLMYDIEIKFDIWSSMIDDLSKIAHWFETIQLCQHKENQIHYFGNNHVLYNFNDIKLNFDNVAIVSVDKFQFLGVCLDPHLSWCEHIDYVLSTISKCIGVVRRVNLSPFKHS